MINKIKKYTNLTGISGNEKLVKLQLKKTFTNSNFEIIEDNLGSICVKIPGNSKKKIGIFAHMDEVGLIVNQVLENGNIKVVNVGGIHVKTLLNQRVKFLKDDKEYTGVVLVNYDKEYSNLQVSDIEIDFGCTSKEQAQQIGLQVGEYINLVGSLEQLQNTKYVTRAADDRIGCAVVEQLFEKYSLLNNDFELYLGGTVQEEVGLKGANTLLNKISEQLDWIIIVDVSPVDNFKDNKIGAGFLLRVAEPRGVYDYSGNEKIKNLAQQNDVKYQHYISQGRTDGAAMQIHNIGNKVNAICIPALNLHTSNTIFDLEDVNAALNMIEVLLDE